MSGFKDALTRKIGPLPAWAWAIIAFVAVWYFRRKFTTGASGLSTSSNTPADATPPQSPLVLGPGESAYDPNTGALVSAPGGSGGGSFDMGQAIEDLASAIQSGITTNAPGSSRVPSTRDGTRGKPRKTRGKRLNKRTIPRPTLKRSKRPRSNATVHHPGRPRKPDTVVRGRRRSLSPTAHEPQRARQRPTHNMTRQVTQQHHETSMPKAKQPQAHVPPRPSSPPKRNASRKVYAGHAPRAGRIRRK